MVNTLVQVYNHSCCKVVDIHTNVWSINICKYMQNPPFMIFLLSLGDLGWIREIRWRSGQILSRMTDL